MLDWLKRWLAEQFTVVKVLKVECSLTKFDPSARYIFLFRGVLSPMEAERLHQVLRDARVRGCSSDVILCADIDILNASSYSGMVNHDQKLSVGPHGK